MHVYYFIISEMILNSNAKLKDYMNKSKALPNAFYTSIRTSDNQEIQIKLLLPPGFFNNASDHEEEEKKENFPMVLNV